MLYKNVNGIKIEITSEELLELGQDSDDTILERAKNDHINLVELARKEYQYSNIIVNNNEFVASEIAQNKLFNYLSTIDWGSVTSINWRLADGITFVKMSKSEINELTNSIVNREISAYQQESSYLSQIEACTTIEEVQAINIVFN